MLVVNKVLNQAYRCSVIILDEEADGKNLLSNQLSEVRQHAICRKNQGSQIPIMRYL